MNKNELRNYYLNTIEGLRETTDYNVFHYGMDKVLDARLNLWGYREDDTRLSQESIFNDVRDWCLEHNYTWNDFMENEIYLSDDV